MAKKEATKRRFRRVDTRKQLIRALEGASLRDFSTSDEREMAAKFLETLKANAPGKIKSSTKTVSKKTARPVAELDEVRVGV